MKNYLSINWNRSRWKGENVATSEIEAVISNVVDLKDAVVYGVQVSIINIIIHRNFFT